MPLYKFKPAEVVFNTFKSYPDSRFDIYGSTDAMPGGAHHVQVYYNMYVHRSGAFSETETHTISGMESLYELNVDRPSSGLIYPFVESDGLGTTFNKVTTGVSSNPTPGDVVVGTYPLSSSIIYEYSAGSVSTTDKINSLKNTINYYQYLNPKYDYSSLVADKFGLITIPSIFYGSSMKKGSLKLKIYSFGELIAEAQDERENGELVQVGPAGSVNSGSTVGMVLYNEGFMFLTSSTAITGTYAEDFVAALADDKPKWIYFAAGANSSDVTPAGTYTKTSFSLEFKGTSLTPSYTVFATSQKNKNIHSNNFSFSPSGSTIQVSGTTIQESAVKKAPNIVSSSLQVMTASFIKTTYISEVGIYDDNKELIAVAKLATPYKKTPDREVTFKIQLDI